MLIWSDWKQSRETGCNTAQAGVQHSYFWLKTQRLKSVSSLPPVTTSPGGKKEKYTSAHTPQPSPLPSALTHSPVISTHPSQTQRKHTHTHTHTHTPGPSYPATPPPTSPLSSPNVLTTLSPADSISVSCRRKCLPPLLPYHRNNAAECSDTAALSAAQYTKADTMPHIGAQTRKTAHSAPVSQTTCTMLPHGDVLMIVSYVGFYLCVYCL